MLCPQCRLQSRVLDTRQGDAVIRRRRACSDEDCGFKWWTVELPIGRTFDFKLKLGPKGLEVANRDEQP